MSHSKLFLRALAVAALTIFASALLLWPAPTTGALDCGEVGGGTVTQEWVLTPEAAQRTAAGECGPNAICKEWCTSACGDDIPLGVFQCFPI